MIWPYFHDGYIFRETQFGTKWRTDISLTENVRVDSLPRPAPASLNGQEVVADDSHIRIGTRLVWTQNKSEYRTKGFTPSPKISRVSWYRKYLAFEINDCSYMLDVELQIAYRFPRRVVVTPSNLFLFDGWSYKAVEPDDGINYFNFERMRRIHAD